MKTATRPQYYRLRRILEMVREGTRSGPLPNCGDFVRELELSLRTIMRDLDFLRDDESAPIAYDDSRKGFKLQRRLRCQPGRETLEGAFALCQRGCRLRG